MAEAMATTHGYIIRGGVRPVGNPMLRSFVLGDERQCQDMVLVLVRVIPVAQRSYMLLFSDGVSCVWALAYNNRSIAAELEAHGAGVHGVEYSVMMTKCAAADGPPYLLCRFISRLLDTDAEDKPSQADDGAPSQADDGAPSQADSDMSHYSVMSPAQQALHNQQRLLDVTLPLVGATQPRCDLTPMYLLVCKGPRRVVAGRPGREELRMSTVDNVIQEIHGRERFFARLCVLGFYQPLAGAAARVVLTDGTHTLLVRMSEMPGVHRYSIVDVEGSADGRGRYASGGKGRRASGLVEATVHRFLVHFGSEMSAHVMQLTKHARDGEQVARWKPVGRQRPPCGSLGSLLLVVVANQYPI